MGIYPGSGKRRPYVQRGWRVLYFLAPKCLRGGYKLRERELSPGLKEKVRVQGRLLEMLICGLCVFAYLRLASGLCLASCPLVDPRPALL
jgi:hypothetical protein